MKRTSVSIVVSTVLCFLIFITGIRSVSAESLSGYKRYQNDFMNLFDTYISFIGYCKSEKDFNRYSDIVYETLDNLNKQFDIYNSYEGISNLKTINDNAGIKPVIVDQSIIDLLLMSKQAYTKTKGTINIAMGSVLSLWHDARIKGLDSPDKAALPNMSLLKAAALNTDKNNIIIDEKANTVFLKNKGMSLDAGALAKGFSAQRAVEAAKKAGMVSGILNAGGNVISFGKPMDMLRDRWGIGIQQPDKVKRESSSSLLDTIYTNDLAVVTSGNYQRFYTVNGKNYNHIIDPTTLMPAERYASVTILHPDSGTADALSTALFILPMDQGKELLREMNAQALWVFTDGSMEATEGYKSISRLFSGYSAIDKK